MSNVPIVIPKPPQLMPSQQNRWRDLNNWTTQLTQRLSKIFGIVGADFDAINHQIVGASGLPITVGAGLVSLAQAIGTVADITQLILVIGNVTLQTDAGNDPVAFAFFRGATQIAGDYLPAIGGGQTVSKTLIGIDSALPVGQYSYSLQAQTGGAGGNTIVTAATLAVQVI